MIKQFKFISSDTCASELLEKEPVWVFVAILFLS